MNNIGTISIETERLLLRRFEYSDCASMLQNWVADENVQLNYGEPVYSTEEEVKGLLDKYIAGYQRGDFYRWAIIDKALNECAGQIAFFLVDSKNHFAEIEYCIGTKFQRRGYATEATKALIRFGFEKIDLHKVQICARPVNKASRGVIEKCGFTYEGTLRDYFFKDGHYESRMYFSILQSEYLEKK
ncbi:MAG: GNAT family N-acetyltransferase [Spirochaetaceae bacterium]|nr:GNAT family N-acetyltransferase [Spirochaetaceae bacterium]